LIPIVSDIIKSDSHLRVLHTRFAGVADVEALTRLINTAFVVERDIFDGDRTSTEGVRAFLKSGKFLVAEDSAGLAGCVYVELRGDRGYIGLLSVDPPRQGSGLGRKLMDEAEKFFDEANCVAVDLRVLSARAPLPAFYRHLGYTEMQRVDVPVEARPKVPCQFICMSKKLN
jgi:ribosomal protein S18 acetylase RimI-like enzyme